MKTKFEEGDKVTDQRGRVFTVYRCTEAQVLVEESLDRFHPTKLRKA